ncbi:type 4a pilus biogenesis protein PilO [Algisphaera agarilytica]|uniref:Tfp pilus assembly protein PilO n=1 Tax=Algisphaera agarilytica TaxID=1385975 RepID=A0A7X0H668_9BACT|nr:type 4a pilus biogenesis protein PilO [Algisphaera agarilytica]MBB6430031.1 Tfp pilus assembly protein PilO [Algisphaera agarilytica]
MQIDKSQWMVMGAIGFMLAAFALGVWLPESKKVAGYQERIASAEEELGPSFFEPAMMDQRVNEVEALKQELSNATRYVPNRPELASVLRSLSQAVESQGVSEQSLQTRETRRHLHYSEIPLTLEFEDTFTASYGVLEQIESLPRLVRVDAMNMRVLDRDGSEQTSPVMQTTLRLSSFYTGAEEK